MEEVKKNRATALVNLERKEDERMKVRPGKMAVALIGAVTLGALAGVDLPVMGTAWYPEMWPAECRANDLGLMQKAGFSSVRIGEFNWAGFEPEEGRYDFADFKSVMDELARRGMTAMMCTATAAPPRWFLLKYPEAWKVTDTKGVRMPIEHRRQYCANNPDFRRAARALTEAQVVAFAGHPAIRAWQLDNEMSSDAEGGHCTCRHCAAGFRAWLKRKYGTLEKLNAAWNGAIWSNRVQDWEQIAPPFNSALPVFRFEYTRFQSESFQAFAEEQAAIIRAKDSRPICYNSWMNFQCDFDLPKFTEKLDFVACDTYVESDHIQKYRAAWDLYRSLKRKPFTVAETCTCNPWTSRDDGDRAVRAWYWEMFAHGADSVYYFLWRRSPMGEEEHGSVLSHDGRPTNVYGLIAANRAEFTATLAKLGKLPLPKGDVAILYNAWDYLYGRSTQTMKTYDQMMRCYAAVRQTGLGVDFIPVSASMNLSKYRLVLAPRMEHLDDAAVAKLADYVAKGGVLQAAVRMNVRGDSSSYRGDVKPYALTNVLGLTIRDYVGVATHDTWWEGQYVKPLAIPSDEFDATVLGGPAKIRESMEDLELVTAKPLEVFSHGKYHGKPLLTENAYGKGKAFYQAATVDLETQKRVLARPLAVAGLRPIADLPDAVSRVRRGDVVIYTSSSEKQETFGTSDVGEALLGAAPKGGKLTLPAYGVAVIKVK